MVAANALDYGRVADTEAQDVAIAVQTLECEHAATGGEGIAGINVGDGAADRQPLRGAEQKGPERQGFVDQSFGIPQCVIAEVLYVSEEASQGSFGQPVHRIPNAKTPNLHHDAFLRSDCNNISFLITTRHGMPPTC